MRSLWDDKLPNFQGQFVSFENAYCRPQPVQPRLPIVIGGHSKAAARRAGRLADGYFPAREAPADLIAEARNTAERVGRDPAALEITASLPDDLNELKAFSKLGVDRVLVPVTAVTGLNAGISNADDVRAWADRIADYAQL